jgi:hypothetical protein
MNTEKGEQSAAPAAIPLRSIAAGDLGRQLIFNH